MNARGGAAGFAALMVALTALFAALGLWQVQRLHDKQALREQIEAGLAAAPQALPPVAQWVQGEGLAYRRLRMTGYYADRPPVLVFTALTRARGKYSGPGHWVLAPFLPKSGGTVFINRGFVPEEIDVDLAPPVGEQVLVGIARRPEIVDWFTPAPDPARRRDWLRAPQRLAALAEITGPVLDYTLDLPATGEGLLPQGGEFVFTLPDNHLAYALTWFGLAGLTPALLLFWLRARRRPGS